MIYAFHMPFFFLVSGYLFRQSNAAGFTYRRALQILVPYVIFMTIIALPGLFAVLAAGGIGDVAWHVKRLMLGGEKLVSPLTVSGSRPAIP